MCRWIAYRGQPLYLESLLFEPENSLISQSLCCRQATVLTNGDGFGIGWYGDRETPAVYGETLPAWNDRNLRSLAHHIKSRCSSAMSAPRPARRRRASTAIRSATANGCSCTTARSAATNGRGGASTSCFPTTSMPIDKARRTVGCFFCSSSPTGSSAIRWR
jgi:hypothetical protein